MKSTFEVDPSTWPDCLRAAMVSARNVDNLRINLQVAANMISRLHAMVSAERARADAGFLWWPCRDRKGLWLWRHAMETNPRNLGDPLPVVFEAIDAAIRNRV